MNYRRYLISIAPRHHQPLPEDLLLEFGCSISEPSNWFIQGRTMERGLTFLDNNGHELMSEVFAHLPVFSKTPENVSEKKEIENLICARIKDVFQIESSQLHVRITDY